MSDYYCKGCKYAGSRKTKYGTYDTCGKYIGAFGKKVAKCKLNGGKVKASNT